MTTTTTTTAADAVMASGADVLVRHAVDVLRSLGDDPTPYALTYGTPTAGLLVHHHWQGDARGLLLVLTDRSGAARAGVRVLSIGRAS